MTKKDSVPEFVFENLASMKKLRAVLKISRYKMATITGIPPSTLGEYETSIRIPSPLRYNMLAEFFDWEEWK